MRELQKTITRLLVILFFISGCGGGGGGTTSGGSGGASGMISTGGSTDGDGTPVTVNEVVVTPSNLSLPKGLSHQYSAEAIMSDGSRVSLTSGVVWDVAAPDVASVSSEGMVKGLKSGRTQVRATVRGVSGSSELVVTDAVLQGLRLSPSQPQSLPKGAQWTLQAIGTFSDGSEFDVTDQASWSSDQSGVASVTEGLVETIGEGAVQIRASLENQTAVVTLTVTSAELVSIRIESTSTELPIGLKQTFRALGLYTDNSLIELTSVDWSGTDDKVAFVNSLGDLSTVAPGEVTISASYSGKVGTLQLTVNNVSLQELYFNETDLDLYDGLSESLTLFGRFSDGSVLPMNGQVSWSSLDASIASVSAAGVVTGQKAGPARIRALSSNGVAEEIWVTVTSATLNQVVLTAPEGPLPVGVRAKIEALGIFSDGTSRDVTTSLQWIPSDANLGTFEGSTGYLNTRGAGTLTVKVIGGPPLRRIESTLEIEIASLVREELLISPGSLEIPIRENQQFQAYGRFSDSRTYDVGHLVSWSYVGSSASSIVASGSNRGRFTAGTSAGEGTVTATHTDTSTASAAVSVVSDATITEVSISPESLTLPNRNSFPGILSATVAYSNGFQTRATRGDYRGTSGIVDAFGSSGVGNVTARGVGNGTISFTYDTIVDSIPVTVTDASLQSLSLSPKSLTLPSGLVSHIFCTGSYSDLSRRDITDTLTWSSSDTRVATVEAGGRLTTREDGVATITALDQASGVTASLDVTVVRKELSSLRFDEGPNYLRVGTNRAFKVEGVFHDGTVYDVTDSVDWNSSNPSVADISPAGTNRGQITSSALGQATISVLEPNSGQEAELTVELVSSVKLGETLFTDTVQEMQNSPDGERLYVLTGTDLDVYRASDMQLLQRVDVDGGVGMDVSSDGTSVLIAQYSQFLLTAVDTQTYTKSTFSLPTNWRPRDVSFGNNGYAYILLDGLRPTSINLTTRELKSATNGSSLSFARYMHYDPTTSRLITGDFGSSPSRVNRYSVNGPDLVWEAEQWGGSNGRALTLHPLGGSFVFSTATGNDIPGYLLYNILLQPVLNMDQPISEMSLGAYPLDSAFSPLGSVLYAINSNVYDQTVHLYCPRTGRDLGRVLPETNFSLFDFQKVEISGDGSRMYLYVTEDTSPGTGPGSIILLRLRI